MVSNRKGFRIIDGINLGKGDCVQGLFQGNRPPRKENRE